jgi:hypothetical protein
MRREARPPGPDTADAGAVQRAVAPANPDGAQGAPLPLPAGRGDGLSLKILGRLDGDGSGGLSLEESSLTSEGFSRVDGDGDGVLTAPEIANAIRDSRDEAGALSGRPAAGGGDPAGQAAPMGAKGQANHILHKLDADKSGGLNTEESGLTPEGFSKVDGNADGVLTAPEIVNAVKDSRDEAGVLLRNVGGQGAVSPSPALRKAIGAYRGQMEAAGTGTAGADLAPQASAVAPAGESPAQLDATA